LAQRTFAVDGFNVGDALGLSCFGGGPTTFRRTSLYDMQVIHFEDLELLKSHAAARDR